MNLVELILKEHSKKQRDKIVKYVGRDPKRFSELINVFLTGPYRVTQRASWPMTICVEKYPELIKPHLKIVTKNLLNPSLHSAVKRNTLRILQYIRIPKNRQGLVADICFQFLCDKKEPVAVKVFAMSVLKDIALQQRELRKELITIIEDQLSYSTPAFISRAKRIFKELGE